ncbi:hypothetical protein HOY82DRAFT_619776 [Tuber indicum]|nr:hypothetical protein HOY82DRAFT_619776 [Tuber indicum]
MTTPSSSQDGISRTALSEVVDGAGCLTVNDIQPFVRFTGLTQEVQKHGPVRPVKDHLGGLTKAEMALAVVNMLNLHQQQSEVLGVVVSHIWEYYVLPERLWEHYDGGKSQFMEDIAFREFVSPTLKSAKESQNRRARNMASLEAVWGEGWEKQIDADIDHPSVLSLHYLRNMAKLASHGISILDAKQVLHHIMKSRLANPGKGIRTKHAIMATDIQKVLTAIASVDRTLGLEPEQYSATHLISILNSTAATIRMDSPLPQTPHISCPFTPPAILPPPGTDSFSVEIVSHSAATTGTQFTPVNALPTSTGLPTPQPTPTSKRRRTSNIRRRISNIRRRIQPNICQVLPASNNIPPPILSPAPSCPPSPVFTNTHDEDYQLRSAVLETCHSAPNKHLPSLPPPSSKICELQTNEGDIDNLLVQPMATERSLQENLLSANLVSAPILQHGEESASTPTSRHYVQSPSAVRPVSRALSPPFGSYQCTSFATSSRTSSARSSSSPDPAVMTESLDLLTSRKRPYSQFLSQCNTIPSGYIFTLPDNWSDNSHIHTSLLQQGFYKCSNLSHFADATRHIAIHRQLNLFDRMAKPPQDLSPKLTYAFQTLLQQALVQNPRMYLTALAAMKTTNYRLISLPVPLIICPSPHRSELMDCIFPYEKYITHQKKIPQTRLLYSLNAAKVQIAASLSTQKIVHSSLTALGGDLKLAAEQVREEHLSVLSLQAGELIAMRQQVLESAKTADSQDCGTTVSPEQVRFAEVRYISLTSDRRIDFGNWSMESYEDISQLNRDLLTYFVTGWDSQTCQLWRMSKAAIEMRGIWAIGDALLGLMNWHSPLVQLELRQLFNAPAGNWFNAEFVDQIEARFDEKLSSMAEILEQVHELAFGTAT